MWAPARRRLTLGLVMTITLVAFEALAISTVMPVVSDDLGGLGLYGWVFSGFFLGNLLGLVIAGQAADRRGTAFPFLVGLVLFTAGLCLGGLAPSMGVLVAARVLQGLGAGAIPAVAYATVGRCYPAVIRPRVFAVFSTAWVVPGLIGPASSSAIEHALSWRAVFLALLPFVVLAGVITIPALTRVPEQVDGDEAEPVPDRRGPAVVLTLAVGVVLAAISGPPPVDRRAAAARRHADRGSDVHRARPARHAAPGARHARRRDGARHPHVRVLRRRRLRVADVPGRARPAHLGRRASRSPGPPSAGPPRPGSSSAGSSPPGRGEWWPRASRSSPSASPAWSARSASSRSRCASSSWTIAGFGIGMAYSPLSVTVLGLAEPGTEGVASSSIQLADVLGIALGTGLGGAFVALGESQGWETSTALAMAFPITCAAAVAGVFAARRLPTTLPG